MSTGPGGSPQLPGPVSDPLPAVAAELAIAGFGVEVVDRWSDGRPAVLAVTSPVTGACAEVTAHGTELELRHWTGPAAGGRITAQVTAVLTAGDDAPGRPAASAARQAALGAPGQIAAQIGARVVPGGALEPGKIGGYCQPQPVSLRDRITGPGGD